jgi:dimeric dUTPase (all-alpha-NTP-PPase superfamily)
MNLPNLFKEQEELDSYLFAKKDIKHEDIIQNQILALFVEVGELAQEVQPHWKYWKEHSCIDRNKVVEEHSDGLHFILSLGNAFGYYPIGIYPESLVERSIMQQLNKVFESIADFTYTQDYSSYITLFTEFIKLGYSLGITDDQIEAAYFAKHEKNHKRWEANY